jgi:hypothetical protein
VLLSGLVLLLIILPFLFIRHRAADPGEALGPEGRARGRQWPCPDLRQRPDRPGFGAPP